MAAEGEATGGGEHEGAQQQDFGAAEDWDAPGEPGDLSSLSAQTEWLNQQPTVFPYARALVSISVSRILLCWAHWTLSASPLNLMGSGLAYLLRPCLPYEAKVPMREEPMLTL